MKKKIASLLGILLVALPLIASAQIGPFIEAPTHETISVAGGTTPVYITNSTGTTIGAATGTASITSQPDTPRALTVVFTDANTSVLTLTVSVIGKDQWGKTRTQNFAFNDSVAGNSHTCVGKIPFAKVTSVTWFGGSGTYTGGSADKIVVQSNNRFGFVPRPFIAADVVKVTRAQAFAAPADIGTAYTLDLIENTILPTTVADTDQFDVWVAPSAVVYPAQRSPIIGAVRNTD